jgi:hypothetical protein
VQRPRGKRAFLAAGAIPIASFALALLTAPDAVADDTASSGPVLSAKPVAPAPAPAAPDRRYELAGFPILGGNTDIGFQFGAAGTLTRFYDQAIPYLWNVDLLLSGSLKDQSGLRLVQQSHVLRLDAPDLFNGRLRLDTRLSFQRTINAGYYGIGNQAFAQANPQYRQEEGRVRMIGRTHTGIAGIDAAFAANLRYETPGVYSKSKLADDLVSAPPGAMPIGTHDAFLAGFGAGFMYDTRDSEFVTQRGAFYQLGAEGTVGSSEQVAYGEASAVIAHYAPLGGPFLFASRFVLSFQFGRVPFYDLAQGGIFEPQYLLGGETGVRGVPQGRYAGKVKVLSNLEVRSMPFPRFKLLGERFRIGTTTFFDAGRVWSEYATISRADGTSLSLKFGIGGGIFLQWGEAAIFRVEAAYSPDAVSENPKVPLGIYVSDGLMF